MKTLLGWIGALALTVSLGASAQAIDVVNEDTRGYQVTITSSSMTRDLKLDARTLSLVVCVGTCEFYVPGVGRATARGNDVITIRNGKFVTQSR
jgi:hypothetical protein